MTFWASMIEAISALRANALRSILTMLGVIIGSASVVTMVAIGDGASNQIEERIASLGTDMMMIFPGSNYRGGRRGGVGSGVAFTDSDVEATKNVAGVIAVAGSVTSTAPVIANGKNWITQVRGVNVDYMAIRDWTIDIGRLFTEEEVRRTAKVVLLGQDVANELFGENDPLGQPMRIKNVPFVVIGVLAEKGTSSWGTSQDDLVITPITTARKRIVGKSNTVAKFVSQIYLKFDFNFNTDNIQEDIESLLRLRRKVAPGQDDTFSVRNMTELLNTRAETQNTMAMLLAATAIVSLIVGGIGIMNIMLVSVTERTREIGLRLAIGARQGDVLIQFLVEAVTLSLLGGVIGILFGLGGAVIMADISKWPVLINPTVIILALGFSVLIGVVFGFYPAKRASLLNPIDALRSE
ncbi:MAG: ABC transporter permease [Sphingomonadales bacterium]